MQLKEMENKLAQKHTPKVFKESLEGQTIKMEPVYIIIDDSIPKTKYKNPATVSRNVPFNYTKAAYNLTQKNLGEGIITTVDIPTDF